MHLTEELGEATIELSRLQLVCNMMAFPVGRELDDLWRSIEEQANESLDRSVENLPKPRQDELLDAAKKTTRAEVKALRSAVDTKDAMAKPIAAKFKEEVSDVFSWLTAVLFQLQGPSIADPKTLRKLLVDEKYLVKEAGGYVFHCPWCFDRECADKCLVGHAVSREVYEKAAAF